MNLMSRDDLVDLIKISEPELNHLPRYGDDDQSKDDTTSEDDGHMRLARSLFFVVLVHANHGFVDPSAKLRRVILLEELTRKDTRHIKHLGRSNARF